MGDTTGAIRRGTLFAPFLFGALIFSAPLLR